MKYFLTTNAEEDLKEIVFYTINGWGEAQASKYYSEIVDKCFEIGENPFASWQRWCEELFPECRSATIGKHIIFFRKQKNTVEIKRILHQSMDIPSHFP